jgi:hypothetical protein
MFAMAYLKYQICEVLSFEHCVKLGLIQLFNQLRKLGAPHSDYTLLKSKPGLFSYFYFCLLIELVGVKVLSKLLSVFIITDCTRGR